MGCTITGQIFDPDRFFRSIALHAQRLGALVMWCVYERPTDYPDQWVARAFFVKDSVLPVRNAIVADSVEELRCALPPGLYRLDRSPGDDPSIREVWL